MNKYITGFNNKDYGYFINTNNTTAAVSISKTDGSGILAENVGVEGFNFLGISLPIRFEIRENGLYIYSKYIKDGYYLGDCIYIGEEFVNFIEEVNCHLKATALQLKEKIKKMRTVYFLSTSEKLVELSILMKNHSIKKFTKEVEETLREAITAFLDHKVILDFEKEEVFYSKEQILLDFKEKGKISKSYLENVIFPVSYLLFEVDIRNIIASYYDKEN